MYPGALPPRGAGHTFCNKSGKYAVPGLGCHRCYSAIVEMRTKGEVISNPGRRLVLCVAPHRLPGWRKCTHPVIVSAAGRDADAAHVGNVERGTLFALWTFHPAFLAFLAQKFHYLTFFESKSQRFSLSLWDCNILAWIFLNIHFFKTPLSAYFS